MSEAVSKEVLKPLVTTYPSNEILSSANKETDAINFAEWVLKSDWQMHKGEWQLRAGNLTFGILKEVNTTEGLYSLYKTGKNGNDK